MKKYGFLFVFLCLVSMGFSASYPIDGFEGYTNDTELRAVWVQTGGWTNGILQTSAGADATTGSMKLSDGGFSNGIQASNIFTPSAGDYLLRFKYMNGQSDITWPNLQLQVIQNAGIVMSASLGGSVVSTWTQSETNAATITGDPLSILISDSSSMPGGTHICAFDEIELVEVVVPLTITVKPTDAWYLSRTEIIKAEPKDGALPYTKVEFDVNNDGSVEFTDTAEPWEFSWDTTSDISIGTSGTITLKTTVTDNDTNTADVIEDYIIDNREGGRESLILNGDFSAWTSGNPDNWTIYQVGGGATVSQGASYDVSVAPSLHINYTSQPDPNRYYYRSVSWDAKYEDIQVKMWGRHAYCRAYIFSSSDSGSSWENTFGGVTAGNPFWVYVEGAPYTHSTSSHILALCTHAYNPGDFYWDDIVVHGIDLSTTKVNDWNLY